MQSFRCRCGILSTFLPCEDCKARAWAAANNYQYARRGICIGQLIRRHHCGALSRQIDGLCWTPPAIDHTWMFRQKGRPVVFVTEPYPGPEVAQLLSWCQERGLQANVAEESWHGFGTLHIEITRNGGGRP